MHQVTQLHPKFDRLQKIYGSPQLNAIYGAGKTDKPKAMFIFMNPTSKNISCFPQWSGIRAPWIGTKNVWKLFNNLNLLNSALYDDILSKIPSEWDVDFAHKIYSEIENNSIYITNLAKCTQIDARPLDNKIFNEYLELIHEEISYVKPQTIITFGNQVSSILLAKPTKVGAYENDQYEVLQIKDVKYKVYPSFYPVGQGMRNMPKAIKRLQSVI